MSTRYEEGSVLERKSTVGVVDVVVPCFNDGVFLLEALESLGPARAKGEGVLIVNDGSTDPATLDVLAGLRMQQGRAREAEALLLQSLDILQKAFGEDHPNLLPPIHALASYYGGKNEWSRAEPLLAHAVRIAEARLGDEHPATPNILDSHGNVLEHLGRLDEAQADRTRATALRKMQTRRAAAN